MKRVTVPVRRLLPGDVLIATRRTVERVWADPYNSKVRQVKLEGEVGFRVWNASTTITVERQEV